MWRKIVGEGSEKEKTGRGSEQKQRRRTERAKQGRREESRKEERERGGGGWTRGRTLSFFARERGENAFYLRIISFVWRVF